MPDPVRIRIQAADGKATVRILMSHEMETGYRKDGAGNPIPGWFIEEVTATHNGKTVLTAQWGPAVAKNPYLQFELRSAKAGDVVGVRWLDNRGESRSDEATVA